MNVRIILAGMLLAICGACTPPSTDHSLRGAELLQPFKANLKKALVEGLQGGAVEAISACSTQAPAIAGELSVDGVVMGRSSHKLRNPENAAPAWLDSLQGEYAAGSTELVPQVVPIERGRVGYVEPIMVQSMCLGCHGAELNPDVAARIEALYPDDQATGFREGDFRGVFWVEFPVGR